MKTSERLSDEQIEQFIDRGYVKIEQAFAPDLATTCRSILWETISLSPDRPDTWTQPVIWIGELGQEPFSAAANTPVLHNAYQQLADDNWVPRTTLGSFPLRFPSQEKTNDTGWHVDASFPGQDPHNYAEWKINIHSRGRALLMLFLFSDVSERDAPTRIRERSHLDVAGILAPAGAEGLTFNQLAQRLDQLPPSKEVLATGEAGTVYLCHPFLVHAAQPHTGTIPKFMAQPALFSQRDFNIDQPAGAGCPIERAIISGIQKSATP